MSLNFNIHNGLFQYPAGFGQALPIAVSNQIEWTETAEARVYEAHLPGLNHDEVRVEIDDGKVLCIIGEKKVEKEERVGAWQHVERARGQFVQRVLLPHNSRVDRVTAHMHNGLLSISVPTRQVGNVKNHRVIAQKH